MGLVESLLRNGVSEQNELRIRRLHYELVYIDCATVRKFTVGHCWIKESGETADEDMATGEKSRSGTKLGLQSFGLQGVKNSSFVIAQGYGSWETRAGRRAPG